MAQVFMSYAREDAARARTLAQAIESAGLSVWWDRSIPPGRSFDEVIEEALRDARRVIVLWSKHSVDSRWVRNEAAEADERGILVPVLIERNVRIPLAHKRLQAADLTDWTGDLQDPVFVQFVGALKQRVSEMGMVTPPEPRPALPAEPMVTPPAAPAFPAVSKPSEPAHAEPTVPVADSSPTADVAATSPPTPPLASPTAAQERAPLPRTPSPPPAVPKEPGPLPKTASAESPTPAKSPPRRRRGIWTLGVVATAVAAIVIYVRENKPPFGGTPVDSAAAADSAAIADSATARAARDSVARADSIARADSVARRDSLARVDSLARADSAARADSISRAEAERAQARIAAARAQALAAERARLRPTATIGVTPSEIRLGDTVTITWNSTNAGDLRIEPLVGRVPARGTGRVALTSPGTLTFRITAQGTFDRAEASATVRVSAAPPPPAFANGLTSTHIVAVDASGREVADYRMVSGGHWIERAPPGSRPTRQLRQERRLEGSIWLRDDERREGLIFDLGQRIVAVNPGNQPARFLYNLGRSEGTGTPRGPNPFTNGRTTTQVTTTDDYGGLASTFWQVGQGAWRERERGGGEHQFRETGRDDWSVYLQDDSRSIALQLDMFTRRVVLLEGGRQVRRLYTIVAAQ